MKRYSLPTAPPQAADLPAFHDYKLQTQPADTPEAAEQYREFSDWYARFNAMASVVMRRIKSVICVPISSLGKEIGVLYISNGRKAEAFNADDLLLASAVGVVGYG